MEPLPELFSIFQGEVAAVTDFGAFIKIPGCRKQGLVHRSHMSSCRVDKPSEMVDVGDKVWVKLIGKEVKDEKLKLSLSMKVVHQGTGKDLDPNNVSLEQDERKRRTFRDYTSQKITLEAVLNTVCKKCGCKGHFAKECFVQPGGTKYSLIPEEEEEEEGAAAARGGDEKISQAEEPSKKRRKEKRKKKKHKAKQSSELDSDSSSSDSAGAEPSSKRPKRSGKASKAKKKKKKKHKK
ncbi:zinc finger CCHC domain-containing protein 17 isoform X3 [Poecile atricapillus]|uniref:zinc finger CCHC domain-containing protein 17 isoform X3 n=1 Tax=Poecile atricapillus TaxID=48891 RepID=UPI0027383394|nr:zinc finger CCHC domain-containing protein 17 isoform X3 [Poecile atricapillus]